MRSTGSAAQSTKWKSRLDLGLDAVALGPEIDERDHVGAVPRQLSSTG